MQLHQAVATVLIDKTKFASELSTGGHLHAALAEGSVVEEDHLLAEVSVVLSHLMDGLTLDSLWPKAAQPEVHQPFLVTSFQSQNRRAGVRHRAIGGEPTKGSTPLPQVAQKVVPLARHGVG